MMPAQISQIRIVTDNAVSSASAAPNGGSVGVLRRRVYHVA